MLDQMREQLGTLQCSYRTEQRYLFWVRRFILIQGKRHPADMAAAEIESFVTHLAVDRAKPRTCGSNQGPVDH